MSVSVIYNDGTIQDVAFSNYPDGTFYTKWRPSEGSEIHAVQFVGTTVDELNRALFLVDALNFRGMFVDYFICPFIPGGRQDRMNTEGDFLFTLGSVASEINNRHFFKVITMDPHSINSRRQIRNLSVLEADAYWTEFIGKYDGVIIPDKGAVNRAKDLAFAINVPCFQAEKVRDVETGQLTGFTFPDVKPGNYLVVDDICDGGGTFIGLANERPEGVNLDLYVTHGVFSKGLGDLYKCYGNVFCIYNFSEHKPTVLTPSETIAVMDKEN